uniref:Zinc finger RING-type eukaryotic domain-containing protein n=1 Tax=Salvator merianae TaxID=96440 RepID=A0A8D0E2U9_SALMN
MTLSSLIVQDAMEALAQVLSCPVCLELFTPPVLVLSCTHNFCRKLRWELVDRRENQGTLGK